jgi:hypothetical protein
VRVALGDLRPLENASNVIVTGLSRRIAIVDETREGLYERVRGGEDLPLSVGITLA